MKNELKSTKLSEIKRDWHLMDAEDKVLGRMATEVAVLLMGKKKSYYVSYLDCGDFVVVINSEKIKVTGKKEEKKAYYRYSGYPGGLKETVLKKMRQEHPERILYLAVTNMLPKNKLRSLRLARLKIFAGKNHPYEDKFTKSEKSKK